MRINMIVPNTDTAPTPPHTILVVEDNPITLRMVRLALEVSGFRVLTAGDGAAALRALAEDAPDLVLQDLLLPDIDGFELVKRLRELPRGQQIPILAFTGFLSKLEEARMTQVGFTDFLIKPVEPTRLVRIIERHLLPSAAHATQPGAGRRVLLVDDDPLARKLMRERLAHAGFDVTTTAGGVEALARLRAERFDLIVSDVLMPNMDGFELCLAVRADPAMRHLPLVLISANYVEEDDRILAERVGASAFVSRLVATDDLLGTIAAQLGTIPPTLSEPRARLDTERMQRVLWQLERQAALATQRAALQSAALFILTTIADTLARQGELGVALDEILAHCLDVTGVARGALYLTEGDRLVLRAQVGYSEEMELVRAGFGHAELLERVCRATKQIPVPSAALPSTDAEALLAATQARAAVLTPIVAGGWRMGLLVLLSPQEDITGEDWLTFARMFAVQIGQALLLSRAFAQLAASEQRYRELAESLRRSNLELEQFAYVVSHDLREPLRMVESYTQLLERSYRGKLDKDADEFIYFIVDGAARMNQLIADILAYSQVGRKGKAFAPVDTRTALYTALANLRTAIEESGAEVRHDSLPTVQADQTQLVQLFQNLIGNAIKFRAQRTLQIEVRARNEGGEWVFAVADNGIGIEPQYFERIFVIFQRLHTHSEYSGTGIGLAICNKIVERHGGRIWVESQPGVGTTFYFTLPAEVVDAQRVV